MPDWVRINGHRYHFWDDLTDQERAVFYAGQRTWHDTHWIYVLLGAAGGLILGRMFPWLVFG